MKTSVIGYPRIGKNRELKFASEKFFKGEVTEVELLETAADLRKGYLLKQKEAGISFISSNDFSYYKKRSPRCAFLHFLYYACFNCN